MIGNFVPYFFRKCPSISKTGFIKLRCFCNTKWFCNQDNKLSRLNSFHGHRTLISTTKTGRDLQKFHGPRFFYMYLGGRKYGKNSFLPNCWHFCKFGVQQDSTSSVFWIRNGVQYFRNFSSSRNAYQTRNRTTAIYTIALVIVVLGASYAAVPLYRIFCQASGLGGTVQQADAGEKIKNMATRKERLLTVRFNADKSATMQWSFKPQQSEVKVHPGETALAFYTAKNPTDFPITGISTYNVIPFEAGQYFNKIQCFCFEEQRLNPHEQVDMPVFFYIDPEFLDDPALYKVDTITLSYTFFQAKEAQNLGIQ